MFLKQYLHRLPIDYDMAKIRSRVRDRGPLWDDTQGLLFKAFAVQERGHHGAQSNSYASIYSWLFEESALEFIFSDRFQSVMDTFGRPDIETWIAIDARRGTSERPAFLSREDVDVPPGTSLSCLRDAEKEQNISTAAGPDAFAAIVGLNINQWRLVRFVLTAKPPATNEHCRVFEVAHLAKPGISLLS